MYLLRYVNILFMYIKCGFLCLKSTDIFLWNILQPLQIQQLRYVIESYWDIRNISFASSGDYFFGDGSSKQFAYTDILLSHDNKSEEAYNLLWGNIVAIVGKYLFLCM